MFRPFRPVRCALFLAALAGALSSQALPVPPDPFSIVHGPYLQNPSSTSMTVIWFTSRPAVGWVEYAPADNFQTFPNFGGLVSTARSVRNGLVDANETRHLVRIAGLVPGKRYRYRVLAKEVRQFEPYEVLYGGTATGDIHEFRTLDPGKAAFRFQVFQDLRGDVAQLGGLFQLAGWETSDLFFFNGDTMDSLKDEAAVFNGFLDFSVGRFAANIPFIYVRGNHDARGAMARQLDEFFPPRDGRFYGSFDHGPVHFIVMDGGEDKPDDAPVYAGPADFDRYRQEQGEWLKTEIRTDAFKKAVFRVAIIHFPLYRKGFTPEQLTRLWGPLFNEGGLDVVLSGHEHRLYRVDPEAGKNAFPVLGAPRGALIRADVTPAALDLKIIDIKGTTLDSLVLPAPKR